MTSWVLVLMLINVESVHSRVVGNFNNETACVAAAQKLESANKSLRTQVLAVCIRQG